jgi:hypothetical protein
MFDHDNVGNDKKADIPTVCDMFEGSKHDQKLSILGGKTNHSLVFERTLTASLSLMKTDRSCPFISKNTSLSPFAVKSSAIASVLIPRVFPLSIVTFVRL